MIWNIVLEILLNWIAMGLVMIFLLTTFLGIAISCEKIVDFFKNINILR
jgi:hypothetical protein